MKTVLTISKLTRWAYHLPPMTKPSMMSLCIRLTINAVHSAAHLPTISRQRRRESGAHDL